MQYFNILLVSLTFICWIVIYPEDSATQYLNNWGQKSTQLSMRTGGKTRLPTVTLAVSGHSGLGDKDNHYGPTQDHYKIWPLCHTGYRI